MTRPYQMRRQARRMRRYGMQPMIMMNAGDGLPELAAVVLARWAWRYRSELAPLALAVGVTLAGWMLHATHPRDWPLIVAAGAIVAAALAGLGRWLGLTARIERAYAGAVTAVTAGWLAAATDTGSWRTPLPQILIAATLVLGVPWWAHRRRRAKVRVERTLAAWPEIASAVGLPGSRLMSAVVDVWGWRARFALARGQTIADVIAKIPAIESGLGTFRGAVRVHPTPDDLASRFELRVLTTDPHADAITWPGPSVTSISQPIDLGPFEDATPATVLFQRRHAMFGGATGSGKSGGLNVLMGNLTACADVVIWAIDLKRGMELGPWASCIDRLATTPTEAGALLADAVAILDARAEYLTARGWRVWEPSPDRPALVIIIDEYAELTESAPDATGDADSIARRGRAPAVSLVVATQRPTQKAMGQGALRSQIDVRVCFRVRERKDVDLILSQGSLATGWHAHTLNAPGKFLISAPEHDTPRRARAYLVTDDAVRDTAARHAGQRPPLDDISRRALEQGRSLQRAAVILNAPAADGQPVTADDAERGPDAVLWEALRRAPGDGVPVADLVAATGMSHRWVNYRLSALADTGRAIQIRRGVWRATRHDGDAQ